MVQPAAVPIDGQRPFKSQILRFLSVVGIRDRERFHPASQNDEETFELRKRHISRAQLLLLLSSSNARPRRLKPRTAETLAGRMQIFLDRAFETHRTDGTLADFEMKLGKAHFDFLEMRRGRISVSADGLIKLYDQEARPLPALSRRSVTLQVDLIYDQAGLSAEDLEAYLTARIKDREYRIIAVREACTRIIIEVPASDAEAVFLAFAGSSDVLSVEEIESPLPRPALSIADGLDRIAEVRGLLLREALFGRPWRRLRWLLSPSVRLSPVAHVIRTSEQRAYARPGAIRHSRALGVDLGMTVLLWPLLGAALLLASMLVLLPLYPRLAIGSAMATGIVMGIAGAQVCSALLSPIACGAGAIPIAWSFGLAHALILGEFENVGPLGAAAIRSDLFTTICGGIVGLTAPAWARIIPAAPVLVVLAVCISSTGWLMAQPAKAGDSRPVSRGRQATGALAGSAAGVGIGIVYLLDRVLQSIGWMQPWSLIAAAFAIAGGVAFTASTGVRFRDGWRRPAAVGLIHALLQGLLIWSVFAAAGSTFGLVALSMATAWFHATWFTAAYVIGFRIGGANGAVAATALEGGLGFTAFVYVRIVGG